MTNTNVTIKLEHPIEIGNELIEEITMRRPKGKDMKACIKGVNNVAESIALAARLSEQLPVVFDEMDGADLTAVLDEVGNFLQRGR